MYAPYNIAMKWVKQRLAEVDMDKFTVTAGDLNTLLLIHIRISRQKVSKYIQELNHTLKSTYN